MVLLGQVAYNFSVGEVEDVLLWLNVHPLISCQLGHIWSANWHMDLAWGPYLLSIGRSKLSELLLVVQDLGVVLVVQLAVVGRSAEILLPCLHG